MPNPKHRHSKSRRDSRRAQKKLKAIGLSVCPQCHEPKLPHYTCLNCGTYKGTPVIAVEET